ncbi:hypothetical protein [Streptomyces sp. NPDC001450]
MAEVVALDRNAAGLDALAGPRLRVVNAVSYAPAGAHSDLDS